MCLSVFLSSHTQSELLRIINNKSYVIIHTQFYSSPYTYCTVPLADKQEEAVQYFSCVVPAESQRVMSSTTRTLSFQELTIGILQVLE